jgi:hypothetical protein
VVDHTTLLPSAESSLPLGCIESISHRRAHPSRQIKNPSYTWGSTQIIKPIVAMKIFSFQTIFGDKIGVPSETYSDAKSKADARASEITGRNGAKGKAHFKGTADIDNVCDSGETSSSSSSSSPANDAYEGWWLED